MEDDDLARIVERLRRQGADDDRVEAKAAEKQLPRSLWQSVSAFANTDGGVILLGLDESTGFAPAPEFDAERCLDQLRAGFSEAKGAAPKVCPVPPYQMYRREVDGVPVVVLEIQPMRGIASLQPPCYVRDQGLQTGSYKRVGDADQHLTTYEIYQLQQASFHDDRTDCQPVEGCGLEDLNPVSVAATLERLSRTGSRALDGIADGDQEGALQRLNILNKDRQVTLAGYLTLGTYPQQEFAQLVIDVAVHPDVEKSRGGELRFVDRRVCDGPLPVAIQDAVEAVMRNLRTRRIVHGATGRDVSEIPEEVLREAITNAVMHRDYSAYVTAQRVAVDVYPDRVEVTNPGGFWGDRTKENVADGLSESRNQVLSKLLRCVPMPNGLSTVAENQGSGVPRMIHAMRGRGLPAPDYSQSTIDHVVVRLERFGLMDPEIDDWLDSFPGREALSQHERSALALAKRNGTVGVADLRNNLGLDSDVCRDLLAGLLEAGLLIGINDGPYSVVEPRESVRLTSAQHEVLAALSDEEPRSVHDLARATGRSLASLRQILRELIGRGVIEATAPPQSRNRQYLLITDGTAPYPR